MDSQREASGYRQTKETYDREFPALGTGRQGVQGPARSWAPLKKHLT